MALLEVKDLAVKYGDVQVVSDISFSLEEGQVLTIVGESGSGKTTVIRAILNALGSTGRISHGCMRLQGEDLCGYRERDWRRLRGKDISMIFQDSGNMLNPVRSIGAQFIEYLQTHSGLSKKEAHEKAVEELARMNLPNPENIMKSYTFELSGGMRQRVGIAMAIAFHPRILLADEPTSALDVTTQAQIVNELLHIASNAKTAMILVTHNIGVAAYMSDAILVMAGGRMIEYGAAKEIIHAPKQPYTKALLAAVPMIGGKRYAG